MVLMELGDKKVKVESTVKTGFPEQQAYQGLQDYRDPRDSKDKKELKDSD